MKIALLSGRARPNAKLRRGILALHGPAHTIALDRVLEDETAIDALARLMTEGMELKTTADGRVDMRDVAAHVLDEMRKHPL